ncbi:hypothetical protein MesoLj113c_56700 [Mesorhizobium sp. 113-3-9]|nr:hypothetical protein MesoLj113c_56700 [Mesorhizobium sp. 113-3-9]
MAKAGGEGKDIGPNKQRAASASGRAAACVHRIGFGKMVIEEENLHRRNPGTTNADGNLPLWRNPLDP